MVARPPTILRARIDMAAKPDEDDDDDDNEWVFPKQLREVYGNNGKSIS